MGVVQRAGTISGFRSETIAVDGVRLHYRIGGDPNGKPVILWHGFLGTGYVWRNVAPALAETGLAVLIPDMRGFGDSDKPAGVEGYDARALGEECRALVAKIGFGGQRPLILAAHDMGAPPALLWAADHPEEVAALLYIEEPVMLGDVLAKIITYTPEAAKQGSLWWWLLPLAPGVSEALIVDNELAFLNWFYQGPHVAKPEVFDRITVDEYLRTFAGREGVLGAMGVYRAAFASIAQTEKLTKAKVKTPVVALGGEKGLGVRVGEMVKLVAETVDAHTLSGCGHFLPEECPAAVIEHILAVASRN